MLLRIELVESALISSAFLSSFLSSYCHSWFCRTVRTLGSSSINIDAAAIAAGAGAIVPFSSSQSTSTSASASPSTSSDTSMPSTDVPPSINEQQILLEEVKESMVQVPSGSEGLVVEISIKESHYDFCRKIIEHFIPEKKRLLEKRNFSEVKMSYRIPKLIYLNFQLWRGQLDDMRNITMATMEIKTSICDKVNIQLSASEESESTGMERIDFRAVEMLLERPMSGPWTLSSTLSISNSSSSSGSSSSGSSGGSSSSSSSSSWSSGSGSSGSGSSGSSSSSSSCSSSTFKERKDHKVASSKDLQDFANLVKKRTFIKISDSHTLRSSNGVKMDGFQEGGVNDVHVGQVSNDRNHMKEHIGLFQVRQSFTEQHG